MTLTLATPALKEHRATFSADDVTTLEYRAWLPETPATRAVILFHRGHEHSARWNETVHALTPRMAETAFFAYDARGHGDSPGERGWAPDFATLVRDADAFVRFVQEAYDIPMNRMSVIAHSVGAVVAGAWLHDYAPTIQAIVLATPAFSVRLYIPLALPFLRLFNKVKRRAFVTSYVKAKMITHDPEQIAAYDNDPQISKQIAVNILVDLADASKRLIKDAGAIASPTLILGAGKDWVVKNSAARRFFNRLSSPRKELHIFPQMGHSIFHESSRDQVFEKVASFLTQKWQENTCLPVVEFTSREFQKLASQPSLLCPKENALRLQRLFLRTMGKLSKGVRLGWETGFNSGQTLDYVYENRATGTTLLGKLIDRFYLNAIGWRGIRQRKRTLQSVLKSLVEQLQSTHESIHIVDVASGPGRYLLEVASEFAKNIQLTLRDQDPAALDQAGRRAAALHLSVTTQHASAFDPASLASITPPPHIVIVSGLYELFPENALVEQSLAGIAQTLVAGGYLIYTNQPWHPQLEMIARCLVGFDRKPWIMRRRTQLEMDGLVERAGLKKQRTFADQWGMFTVNVATKPL